MRRFSPGTLGLSALGGSSRQVSLAVLTRPGTEARRAPPCRPICTIARPARERTMSRRPRLQRASESLPERSCCKLSCYSSPGPAAPLVARAGPCLSRLLAVWVEKTCILFDVSLTRPYLNCSVGSYWMSLRTDSCKLYTDEAIAGYSPARWLQSPLLVN